MTIHSIHVKVDHQSWNFLFQIENGIDLIESNVFLFKRNQILCSAQKRPIPHKNEPKMARILGVNIARIANDVQVTRQSQILNVVIRLSQFVRNSQLRH